jgi:putative Mg2+ transporter-C (MgtC) family protein
MFENVDLFADLFPRYALRLGVAALCGCALGIERERKDKAAGLRTVMLITVGAALFMIVSDLIPVVTKGPEDVTRVDPSRIASQVVTGIGFLGGGAIIQSRGTIHGLTTAAVIWTASGIGLCIGVGFPIMGGVITGLVLATLVALDPVRAWLGRFGGRDTIELIVPNDALTLRRVEYVLRQHGGEDDAITLREHSEDTLNVKVSYAARGSSSQRLLDTLAQMEGVRGTRCEAADDRGASPDRSRNEARDVPK